MNRTEMRNYYRKCAGYLSLMNAIFLFIVSCLAIYIADFDELDVDEGTGVVILNGLYFIFTVGIVFAILSLVAGFIAVRGKGEGIFGFSRFTAAVNFLMMIFSAVTAVYVIKNNDIQWTGERSVMTRIYLAAGLISVFVSAIVFLYSHGGRAYYDRAGSLAKEAPDIDTGRPVRVEHGLALICAAVFNAGISGLALYFCEMIKYFDRTMVEDNEGFAMVYQVLFVIGIIVAVQSVIVSILHWCVNREGLLKLGFITVVENYIYIIVFATVSLAAVTKDFVKSQSPDVSYIIFAFILCMISALYLYSAAAKTFAGRRKKEK